MTAITNPAMVAECVVARRGDKLVVAGEEALKPLGLTNACRYTCVTCKAVVTLKRTKHERYYVNGFFAHKKIQGSVSACTGGGPETQDHLLCKYYLKEFVGHYDFCVKRCPRWRMCKDVTGLVTKASDLVEVEKSMWIDGRRYIYDVLISRKGKPVVAVEVKNTHACGSQKIEDTRRHGIALVEIRSSEILGKVSALREAKVNNGRVSFENDTEVKTTCDECERAIEATQWEMDSQDSWSRLLFVTLQWKRITTQEHERLYDERKELEEFHRHRKLQYKAYRQAEEAEKAFGPLRGQRAPYNKSNFKCVQCDFWRTPSDLRGVHQSKWPARDFRGRGCCRLCVVECPKCGDCYPLQGALRFGLCLDCNLLG